MALPTPLVYGAGIHGLADESSVFLASAGMEMETDVKFVKNHNAADAGLAIGNERTSWRMAYFMETADTHPVSALGGAVTLDANNVAMITNPSSDASPEVFCTGLTAERMNDDFQRGTLTGVHRPLIASA